jgi:TolA-binding protein
MNRRLIFIFAFCIAGLMAGLVYWTARNSSPFHWERSYAAALDRARTTDRFLIAYLYTDWCGYCRRMESETFTDSRVAARASSYVWLGLNAEADADGAKLREQFHIAGYPMILIFDKQGRRIDQLEGFLPPDQFLNALSAMTIGPDSLPALEAEAARQPTSAEAEYALASKYLDLNEYKSATAAFRKAIELDPTGKEGRTELAYYHLAVCLASDREQSQAQEVLEEFARRYPDSQLAADALILQGQVYYHEGDWARSMETFKLFLARYPEHGKAALVERMLGEVMQEAPLRSAH